MLLNLLNLKESTMSIKDFFKYQATLNKIQNCGILSKYLNPFSTWLSDLQFSIMKAARHITNVAHLSHYLKNSSRNPSLFDIHLFNNYSSEFLTHHIPVCSCSGWNKIRRTKEVNYSLNRFKQFLTACYGIEFEKEYKPFSWIQLCKTCLPSLPAMVKSPRMGK